MGFAAYFICIKYYRAKRRKWGKRLKGDRKAKSESGEKGEDKSRRRKINVADERHQPKMADFR